MNPNDITPEQREAMQRELSALTTDTRREITFTQFAGELQTVMVGALGKDEVKSPEELVAVTLYKAYRLAPTHPFFEILPGPIVIWTERTPKTWWEFLKRLELATLAEDVIDFLR